MELKPHDLLKISDVKDIISYTVLPEWVEDSLSLSPFVVVRRAIAPKEQVAIGIRGQERSERFAAFLPIDRIIERIIPEQLARRQSWKRHPRYIKMGIFSYLDEIAKLLGAYEFTWGPTGSIGFELASGREMVTKKSDIDIVIRSQKKIPMDIAMLINKYFKESNIRVDVQVETNLGAFSLDEYSREISPILLRTMSGPKLLDDPWEQSSSRDRDVSTFC